VGGKGDLETEVGISPKSWKNWTRTPRRKRADTSRPRKEGAEEDLEDSDGKRAGNKKACAAHVFPKGPAKGRRSGPRKIAGPLSGARVGRKRERASLLEKKNDGKKKERPARVS